MNFKNLIAFVLLVTAGCVENTTIDVGPNGLPYQRAYVISQADTGRIQFSMLDGVNSIRHVRGLSSLSLNAKLNAAAATHSRDMAVQNRAWHFGSDGSSPPTRLLRVGYRNLRPSPPGWTIPQRARCFSPIGPKTWGSAGFRRPVAKSGGPWLPAFQIKLKARSRLLFRHPPFGKFPQSHDYSPRCSPRSNP